MSPVRAQWAGVLDAMGEAAPLGRLLTYAEQRYWLLSAIELLGQEQFGTDGTVAAVGARPEDWAESVQTWRLYVEKIADAHQALAVANSPAGEYVATVLAACSVAISRLANPSLQYTDLWCSGQLRRVYIGRAEKHSFQCACGLFDETVRLLEDAANGEDPWRRWSGEPRIWLGLRGLCGPHVVRLIHGVPSSLEEVSGLGHAEAVFDWGCVGRGTSQLAQALLDDAMGEMVEADLAERFATEVVALQWQWRTPFALSESELSDWIDDSHFWHSLPRRTGRYVASAPRRTGLFMGTLPERLARVRQAWKEPEGY
jgi:hypothetical protein